MRRWIAFGVLLVIVGHINTTAILAQSGNVPRVEFEVASVKLYPQEGGGPRNSLSYSPQGINVGGCALGFVIGEAYNFPVGRISGPDSLTKKELWGGFRKGTISLPRRTV
jgi:hypothetical protein